MKQLTQIISTRDRAAQSYEPLMDDVHLMLSFLPAGAGLKIGVLSFFLSSSANELIEEFRNYINI